MPKRTNKFQQLVFLLQRQLGEGTVEESAMLKDRVTGDESEVDIAVTKAMHGISLVIGFECRDTRRKVDRNAVQQLIQKHRHLTDKLVVVSRSGFTGSAIKLCEKNRAETITFSNANAVDWKGYVEQYANLVFGMFDMSLIGAPTVRYTHLGPTHRNLQDSPTSVLRMKEKPIPLQDAVQALIRNGVLGRKIMDHWFSMDPAQRPTTFDQHVTFKPMRDDPWVLLQGEEGAYRLDEMDLVIRVTASTEPFSLSPMQFMETRVMEGSVTMSAGQYAEKPIQILVSEDRDGRKQGSIVFPALAGEQGPKIHDAKFTTDEEAEGEK